MAAAHETLGRRACWRNSTPPRRDALDPVMLDGLSGRIRNGGSTRMNMSDFKPQHFNWLARRTASRVDHAQPAGAQEPAHLRILRRAARPVPRPRRDAATSRPSCSARTAAISAPAATCTTSSARWSSCDMKGLLAFTRMTGDLVKAMRACPQPIIAAIDGVCVGAGAIIAHGLATSASARREARPRSCSRASGSPAATWAPARSCRASSARAARPSCSTPAAP